MYIYISSRDKLQLVSTGRVRHGRNSKRSLLYFPLPILSAASTVNNRRVSLLFSLSPLFFLKRIVTRCVCLHSAASFPFHAARWHPAGSRRCLYSNVFLFFLFLLLRGLGRSRCWFVAERKLNSYRRNQHGWRCQPPRRQSLAIKVNDIAMR